MLSVKAREPGHGQDEHWSWLILQSYKRYLVVSRCLAAFLHRTNIIAGETSDDATVVVLMDMCPVTSRKFIAGVVVRFAGPGIVYRLGTPKTGDARYHFWEGLQDG